MCPDRAFIFRNYVKSSVSLAPRPHPGPIGVHFGVEWSTFDRVKFHSYWCNLKIATLAAYKNRNTGNPAFLSGARRHGYRWCPYHPSNSKTFSHPTYNFAARGRWKFGGNALLTFKPSSSGTQWANPAKFQ